MPLHLAFPFNGLMYLTLTLPLLWWWGMTRGARTRPQPIVIASDRKRRVVGREQVEALDRTDASAWPPAGQDRDAAPLGRGF